MRILSDTYFSIIEFFQNDRTTEQGGILGSTNKDVIDVFFPDICPNKRTKNVYEPNILVLNKELRTWSDMQIKFCGIVHSHLTETPKLSLADKVYIKHILSVMPKAQKLWFPIVLYEKETVEIMVYSAELDERRKVKFYSENLEII